MDADLVCSPAAREGVYHSIRPEYMPDLILRYGRTSAVVPDGHLLAIAQTAPDGDVDDASLKAAASLLDRTSDKRDA